jgi:hypothetical protein
MNLGDMREKVGDLRSRRWTSDDAKRVFRVSIAQPALKQLAAECPEAFIPDQETVIVYQDWTSTSMGRKISATTDLYVLNLGAVAAPGAKTVAVDGTWDCIYYLEVDDDKTDGAILRRRCVEFFTSGGNVYVTIDRPWRNTTDADLTFRMYQRFFYTRDDVTAIVDGRVFGKDRTVLFPIPAGAVRLFDEEDYHGEVTGRPRRLSRWGHEKLEAPVRAPSVALATGELVTPPWVGPDPPGTFLYRYTYVWGKKDFELSSQGGQHDPVLESSPSPPSAEIVLASAAAAVDLTNLTNIDYIRNYDPDPAEIRNGHGGWRKRIYRARKAIVTAGGMKNEVEAPEYVYHFLDEVDGTVTSYRDDGSVTPDYTRRLPESHGYFQWAVTPHAEEKHEIDFRVYRRPGPLLADTDAPQVHPDFEDLLLLLLLRWAAMADKQPAEAADYYNQFVERRDQWRAKDANPTTTTIPVTWSMEDYGHSEFYRTAKSVVGP